MNKLFPDQRLAKNTVKVMLIRDLLLDFSGYIIIGILLLLSYMYRWDKWIVWILIILILLAIIGTIWNSIRPFLIYRNFRYSVNEEFFQIKTGALLQVHHVIPMTKVQSVTTKQDPIQHNYNLCTLSIKTIAAKHTIPSLPYETAIDLRDKIADFAKIKEVEV